jgi:hypothetical protein
LADSCNKVGILQKNSLTRQRPWRSAPKNVSTPNLATVPTEWLRQLLSRKPRKLAAVALANTGFPLRRRDGVPQMARIVWAVMISGEVYRHSPAIAIMPATA